MSRVVWKYAVPIDDQWWPLPEGGQVVAAALGKTPEEVTVWVLQHKDVLPASARKVRVFGTGHDVPDGALYRGTVFAGVFVWHLFEMDRPE
jgi:hypothetical protein